MANRTCSIDGCDNKHNTRSWCQKHYWRWKHHGTTDKPPKPTDEDRFWAKVGDRDDCWLWVGALNNKGYGQFWDGRALGLAHRWSYEHHVGSIPDGLVIDHLCRTPACVNPEHLEPVTQEQNMARARRKSCRRGHPWPEHEYRYPDGRRECRTCSNNRRRERRQRAQKERESWLG